MRVIGTKSWTAPANPDPRAGLLAVEWLGDPRNPSCPSCRLYRHSGHHPDCPIGRGLGRIPYLPGVVRRRVDIPGTYGIKVLAEYVITDDIEAQARAACSSPEHDPDHPVTDPSCAPDSPAAAVDRVPAWWAWLHECANEVVSVSGDANHV